MVERPLRECATRVGVRVGSPSAITPHDNHIALPLFYRHEHRVFPLKCCGHVAYGSCGQTLLQNQREKSVVFRGGERCFYGVHYCALLAIPHIYKRTVAEMGEWINMLSVTIIAVGSVKEKALRALCEEYAARLGPYAKLTLKEVPSAKRPHTERERAVREEGDAVLAAIPPNAHIILLTEHGKTLTSTDFSTTLNHWSHNGQRALCFVIAGAFGPDQRLLATPHEHLSLSPMTFPHEWARLLLLEQLFRGCTIRSGKTYHY